MSNEIKQARWWEKASGGAVICHLCPRRCRIQPGSAGFCAIRRNVGGTLYSDAYGYPIALQLDPIEKKPLAEYLSGTKTFSIGTYGCNLSCSFCQNYHLSRGSYNKKSHNTRKFMSPEDIVNLAVKYNTKSIAFTYNEPLIWSEYLVEIAELAKERGVAAVLVSNGYITESAASEILPFIDAANFDMKGFSEEFYKEMTGGSLSDVLRTIRMYYQLGGHLEITNLVIPGKNDSPELINKFLEWTKEMISTDVPLHFSAYSPSYKYSDSPPTPASTLYRIKKQAEEQGFTSVYLGNIGSAT